MPQKNPTHLLLTIALLLVMINTACIIPPSQPETDFSTAANHQGSTIIELPDPDIQGAIPLEQTLANRRSQRQFQTEPLSDSQLSQLLWSAQGVTHPSGYRTAPSAGALYPLEIYAAMASGLYHYDPGTHTLVMIQEQDPRPSLHQAALRQNSVLEAPLVIIITADFARTAQKYGDARSPQYVYLEAGHAAQNILLQAVALELGAVPIGAFYDGQLLEALSLPSDLTPVYLIPVGRPK